jgi:spoIIIJ-associated protein
MSESTFEATSVQAALDKAAAAMGVAVDDLEHEVVEEKRDFWGTGNDTVVIKAWKRAAVEPQPAEKEQPAPADEPAPQAATEETPAPPAGEVERQEPATAERGPGPQAADETPAPDEAEESRGERDAAPTQEARPEPQPQPAAPRSEDDSEGVASEEIAALLAQIFHDMEFECAVEVETEEGGFLATVTGEDKEALLEGNGRCLSALELIANNSFRNRMSRDTKIRVDAGDFRSRRDQELTDIAYQVAHSAKQSGRTQETQPLNPYERRLVHLALAEDPAVSTRSRGSGFLKNVQVIPQSGADRRGGRGRGRRG